MSTKRAASLSDKLRWFGPLWMQNTDDGVSAALAVTLALVRALRDRGLLSEGEIDDLFDDAAKDLGQDLRDTSGGQDLLRELRFHVGNKDEE
jgi:hypothetical protein